MKTQNETFFKNIGLTLPGVREEFSVENSSSGKSVKLFVPFSAVVVPLFFLYFANPLAGGILLALTCAVLFFLCVTTTANDKFGKFIYRFILKTIKDAAGGSFLSRLEILRVAQFKKAEVKSIALPVPFSPPRRRLA